MISLSGIPIPLFIQLKNELKEIIQDKRDCLISLELDGKDTTGLYNEIADLERKLDTMKARILEHINKIDFTV